MAEHPREIRRRIRSGRNISQITRAMEMVAASKMRRAQQRVVATRPYADRMRRDDRLTWRRSGSTSVVIPVARSIGPFSVRGRLWSRRTRACAGSLNTNIIRKACAS